MRKLAKTLFIIGIAINFFVGSTFKHLTIISANIYPAIAAGVIAAIVSLVIRKIEDKVRKESIFYLSFSATFTLVSIVFATSYFLLGQSGIDELFWQ